MWESTGIVIEVPFWNGLLDQHLGPCRASDAWKEGRTYPFDQAVELALSD
jgi:hypothetical protein